MRKTLTFALSFAVLHVSLSRADEGRIPIFEPTTISAPGHYVVTRDIVSSGPSVILIEPFNNVTLDLNGHTLTAAGGPVSAGILIGPGVRQGLTIRNGRIKGAQAGFGIYGSPGGPLDIKLEGLEVWNFEENGIDVPEAGQVEIVNCRIHDIRRSGIVAWGNPSPFTGSFVNNTIYRIQGHGLDLINMTNGRVSGNLITDFGLASLFASGINLEWTLPKALGGNQVVGNHVSSGRSTFANGIYLDAASVSSWVRGNSVVDNVVNSNGGTGIIIEAIYSWIARNVVTNNGGDGIRIVEDIGHLEGNGARGNEGGCQVRILGVDTTYRNNIGSLNPPGCIAVGNFDLGGNDGL